jgi:putative peptidoglycan lipid II flippase
MSTPTHGAGRAADRGRGDAPRGEQPPGHRAQPGNGARAAGEREDRPVPAPPHRTPAAPPGTTGPPPGTTGPPPGTTGPPPGTTGPPPRSGPPPRTPWQPQRTPAPADRGPAQHPRTPAPPDGAAGPPLRDPWRSRPGGQPAAPHRPSAASGRPPAPGYRPPPTYRRPAGGARGQRRPAAPGDADVSLLRSSGGMALGTLVSRVTGFLRTLLLAAAVGSTALGNAYNTANTLPNVVYDLMLGGILTSVVVPLLVTAARRDPDRGESYFQRMFTLGVIALGAITLVATLAAALIVDLYAGSLQGPTRHLMVVFAYFFIPQIFFYGVSSLAGAILNARGRFAAPMWTPVINNIVVILILLMYLAVAGAGRTPVNITSGQVLLLGVGTTLGIVAQTAALIPSLLRCGFRPRPTFGFRRAEVAEIGRMAGWLSGYVITTQVTFLTTARIANTASKHAPGAGFAAYTYAYQLFQMPYAIVAISVITALLPRMSAHAAGRRYSRVRADFSTGIRLSAVIVVPTSLLLAVLGGPLSVVLFGHGSTSVANANYIGEVFAVFSLGLVPYMTFQLLLRVFYSLHDSRTPCFIGIAAMAVNITINVIALNVLPAHRVVLGLAAGYCLAYLVGAVLAWWLVLRRVGSLDGRAITRSLVKIYVATIPPVIFAFEIKYAVGVILPPGFGYGLVTVLLAGGGGLLLYVLFARALRIREMAGLMAMIGARFGRGQAATAPQPPRRHRGGPGGRRRR